MKQSTFRARAYPPGGPPLHGTARLPVWLADQFVADLRRLAAQGDVRAAEQLEALAAMAERR